MLGNTLCYMISVFHSKGLQVSSAGSPTPGGPLRSTLPGIWPSQAAAPLGRWIWAFRAYVGSGFPDKASQNSSTPLLGLGRCLQPSCSPATSSSSAGNPPLAQTSQAQFAHLMPVLFGRPEGAARLAGRGCVRFLR